MHFTTYMIVKAVLILVVVAIVQFWKGFTGRD